MARADIGNYMRNSVANMYMHVVAMEQELNELKELKGRKSFGRYACLVPAMENSFRRMRKDLEEIDTAIEETDDQGGFCNWLSQTTKKIGLATIGFCISGLSPESNYQEEFMGSLIPEQSRSSPSIFATDNDDDHDHDRDDRENESGGSRQKRNIQKADKDRAIQLAIRLSRLLIDFFSLILKSSGDDDEYYDDDDQEIIEVFRGLKAGLESENLERDNLMVVNKMFELVETGEKEVRVMAKSNKNRSKKQIDDDQEISSSKGTERKFLIDGVLKNFCELILHLEAFLTGQSVSELLLLTEVVLTKTDGNLGQCESELNMIETRIGMLTKLSSFKQNDSKTGCGELLKRQLELKVAELWVHKI